MKPIHEITLFDSATEIEDIGAYVQPQNWVEISIPIDGMLVNDKLFIKDLSQDQMVASTTNIGNFCSNNESIPVFLKVHNSETVIVGRLVKLIIRDDEVHLRDFRLLKQGWKERSEERVQPKYPIYFTLRSGKRKIRGSLHDISLKGLCVIANIPLQEIPGRITNSDVKMTLNIQPLLEDLHVCGIVKDFRYLTDSLTRIGLEIFLDRSGFKDLSDYIRIRKQEIADEVFSNFREMLSYRQAHDLRF